MRTNGWRSSLNRSCCARPATPPATGQPLTLRTQTGYERGNFFVYTFIGEHAEYHARALADP